MSARRGRAFELRVLQGEQQGARTAVPADTAIHIGPGLDSDVVLRGLPGAAGNPGEGGEAPRFSVRGTADGVHLAVHAGQVQAEGHALAAGQSRVLPLGTPLTVGQTQVALVLAEGPERAEADEAPGPRAAGAAAVDATVKAAAPATPDTVPPPNRFGSWPRWLLAGGAALTAASVGVLAFAYTVAPTPPTPEQQAQRAEALLQGAAMPRLTARANAQGVVQITGYLETSAQRARAEQLLVAERLPRPPAATQIDWQVWVNETVVAAVHDVFRAKGIKARVEALGPGAVRVHTSVADPLLLDDLRSTARRDVPGLAALEVHNTVPSAHATPAVVDDPGKRVASIVPGDPPYIVTVDGTRYFEGALLPSGHRIAGIEDRQVLLEFNGVRTPLVF